MFKQFKVQGANQAADNRWAKAATVPGSEESNHGGQNACILSKIENFVANLLHEQVILRCVTESRHFVKSQNVERS